MSAPEPGIASAGVRATAPPRLPRESIAMMRSGRWTPMIALLIAIVLVIGGAAMASYIDSFNTRQKIDDFTVQARVLAATVTAALEFGDKAAAREYANALNTDSEIQLVAIYDQAGLLFVANVISPGR